MAEVKIPNLDEFKCVNLTSTGEASINAGTLGNNGVLVGLNGSTSSSNTKQAALSSGNKSINIRQGYVSSQTANAWHTVTLSSPFPDANYVVCGCPNKDEGNNSALNIRNQTSTKFEIYLWKGAAFPYIAVYISI